MTFALKPRQTLLFTGDSITDCGRRDANKPLGNGYVSMATDLIVARYPAHNLNVINTGISGHTTRDLLARWTDDVIRYQPDWLSLMIGINDVHRFINNVPGSSVTAAEFAEYYDRLLTRIKKETKAKIILIDPFYISLEKPGNDDIRGRIAQHLPGYIKTVHNMVRKYATRHVKLHDLFQQALRYYPAERFCPEPVHPNPSGHLFMAQAWLGEMGW